MIGDELLGYSYGSTYREPNNRDNISKSTIHFQYESVYKYGSNFLNLDMVESESSDPASGGQGSATETYQQGNNEANDTSGGSKSSVVSLEVEFHL